MSLSKAQPSPALGRARAQVDQFNCSLFFLLVLVGGSLAKNQFSPPGPPPPVSVLAAEFLRALS
jgi:hypothetical protein